MFGDVFNLCNLHVLSSTTILPFLCWCGFEWNHVWPPSGGTSVLGCNQLCLTLCDPMAPLSMGFSRQDYWRGLQFPSPGDLPGSWNHVFSIGRWILYHWSPGGDTILEYKIRQWRWTVPFYSVDTQHLYFISLHLLSPCPSVNNFCLNCYWYSISRCSKN